MYMCRKWGLVLLLYLFLSTLLQGQGRYILNESFDQKPLSDIFQLLEKKFHVKFAFDEDAVSSVRITRQVQAKELKEALDQLFEGAGLVYQIPAPGQVLVRKEYHAPEETASFMEIQGRVTDNWSGAPLPYAHVLYSESDGVATDESGRFRCRVPIKEGVPGNIQVQYIGYQPRKLTLDSKNPPGDLNIRLSPRVEKLPGIVVKEKAPLISQQPGNDGSTLRISPLATMSFFVGGKDIFRGLQMLPGMNASDDLSADLSVRSGNGDENLVLLDGMTLYNVTHFFGIFSIVNPNIVDQVKIYKNAFPAEYGGRTSAIIDMRTQPMRQEGWQGVTDLNILTSNAVLEAPIAKNMSLLLGLRTTNQDLGESSLFSKVDPNTSEVFLNLGPNATSAKTVSTQQPNFRFYDANLKWTWQPSANTRLLASYFRGNDQFAYDFDRKIYPQLRRNTLYFQEEYVENAHWQNEGASLSWNQQWAPSFKSQLVLAQSKYQNETRIGSEFSKVQNQIDSIRTQFSNTHFNLVEETNVHAKNTWALPRDQTVDVGYQGVFSHVRFHVFEDSRSPLNGNKWAPQHALYAQYQSGKTLGPLSLNLGLRHTAFDGKSYWSPRIYLDLKAEESVHLKGSFGLYQQFVRQLTHEDRFGRSFQYWVLSDDRFPIATTQSAMLGFSHKNAWFDLDVEFYLKSTDGVMEHALQRTGLPAIDGKPAPFKYVLFKGEGKTKGVDVLLQKSTSKYAWWVAYTLSKSTQSFPQIFRNEPFPSPNDRRHQLKLNGQYTMGKFDFGASYIFASGRPYTDLSALNNQENDRTVLDPDSRLEYLEDYHRMDLYGNYSFSIKNTEAKIGLSLYNILDRENVKYRQFIYSFLTPPDGSSPSNKLPVNTVAGTELEMLGFTPNISFQIKF